MKFAHIIRRAKPGVPRSVHLFAAPFLWTAVGCMLMVRGFLWLGPGIGRWLVVAGLVLGTIKSFFVLDKVAHKASNRILLLDDGACLGAMYSWKSWMLIGVMIITGIVLRHVGHPGMIIGTLYCAIGWALCFSSRVGWKKWYNWRKSHAVQS